MRFRDFSRLALGLVPLVALAVACSSEGTSPKGAMTGGTSAGGSDGTNTIGGSGSGLGGSATTGGSAGPGDAGAGGEEPAGPLRVTRTRTEYREDPLGIDVAKPRLDWLLASDLRDERQTAYQVLVATSAEGLAQGRGDLWDSGKVMSDQSAQVEYGGPPLEARAQAFWKVRAWDKDDLPSAYSKTTHWEVGLLAESDWSAKWIAGKAAVDSSGVYWIWYPKGDPATSAPAGDRFFRKSFTLANVASVTVASCVLTADNSFKLFVNGTQVGSGDDWHQTPTFNILSALTSGTNVIATCSISAKTWWAGRGSRRPRLPARRSRCASPRC